MMEVPQGDTYHIHFTTRAFSSGQPTALTSGTFAVYEEGSATPIQTTQALTASVNSVVGLNLISVVATSGNGYDVGSYYNVSLDAGTVGGVSVVGEVVGGFRCMPPEDASAGVKDVNVTHVGDTAQTANDNGADINAIKTKTDSLTFTVAGDVDCNVQSWSGTAVGATQQAGFPTVTIKDGTGTGEINTNAGAVALVDLVTTATTATNLTTNNDKTGYSLTQTFPTNFADMSITVTTGQVSLLTATQASIDAIETDTDELQTDWANAGRLDAILDARASQATADAIETDTQDIQTQVGTAGAGLSAIPWNAAWDTEVESEVNDALDTAISELTQAAPTATPTIRTGLMLLYMALRNRLDVNTSGTPDVLNIYNDSGTVIAKKQVTDSTGDYSEAEMESGP